MSKVDREVMDRREEYQAEQCRRAMIIAVACAAVVGAVIGVTFGALLCR